MEETTEIEANDFGNRKLIWERRLMGYNAIPADGPFCEN
jgi:hypothetical protein